MVNFVQASAFDAAFIADIHMRSWDAAYGHIIPADFLAEKNATRPEQWKRILSGENKEHYTICREGKTVGFMTVAPHRYDDLTDDVYELHGLYLHPDYYRQGIGTQAMEFAIDLARSLGKKTMVLNVLEENTAARRFYEKCGFVFDGTKTEINYGVQLAILRYKRDL